MNNSVLLGLSGGVDSTTSAYLLKKRQFNVTGCYLFMNEDSNENTLSYHNARETADRLGIELTSENCKQKFKEEVTDYFIKTYQTGKTPNPCIRCNPTVKFFSLAKKADLLGLSYIATGHYANIKQDPEDGVFYIHTSPSKKDQSYFLYRLPQHILSRTIFPLGEFESKEEIRNIAASVGFCNAASADSQEICFIPDNDYIGYILNHSEIRNKPGDFIDINNRCIGKHAGIIHYTVGQRKGLGAFGEPKYVKSINPFNNTVTLCNADERFSQVITASDLFWTSGKQPIFNKIYGVKIRSTAKPAPAELTVIGNKMTIKFETPALAPSPGQSAVVYDGDKVLGGGIIE